MNAPPDQKKAPRCEESAPGGKASGLNRRYDSAETDSRQAGERSVAPRAARAAGLPCLNRNISTEHLPDGLVQKFNKLSTAHRKTAFALAKNVAYLCRKYTVERIGFLTLTFADHVTCAKEAGKRFNSLRTHVLGPRYAESVAVLERMKSGRIHFHLLVVLAVDVRTGFDFDLAEKGTYSSANAALRSEWAFWRSTAPKYRFGRSELLPVKSNEDGLSKYVGKYIAKHIGARENRDKGVRLVRYSRDAKPCGTKFMFVSPRSALWRWQVGEFARKNGCADFEALALQFGKRWAYFQAAEIMRIQPAGALWEVWQADRMQRASTVAGAVGCSDADAYSALYLRGNGAVVEFTIPAWKQNPRVEGAPRGEGVGVQVRNLSGVPTGSAT